MAATRPEKPTSDPRRVRSPAEEAWTLLRELLFAERRRFFETAAEFELHPAQAGALMHLDDQAGVPMHEIAAHLACDNSNVTGIVDRLEARGLVTRRASERDRRVKYIVPTALGLEVRDAMRERLARPPDAIERLSPSDQRLLRDLLARATAVGERAVEGATPD
jgi:MarR family transcriptional regulator, organic hydroperoxide resistance regulator